MLAAKETRLAAELTELSELELPLAVIDDDEGEYTGEGGAEYM
jgi:hypothetical protein